MTRPQRRWRLQADTQARALQRKMMGLGADPLQNLASVCIGADQPFPVGLCDHRAVLHKQDTYLVWGRLSWECWHCFNTAIREVTDHLRALVC